MAKARILEITLSVAGAGIGAGSRTGARAVEDSSSGDNLVVWVTVKGPRKIRLLPGRIARYRRIGARPDQADLTMAGTVCR